ncbi:MOSC domain-containing protein [Thiohalophilus thiocyanatoxydans]|uniref:MOSC domain-containing protein YiiM n=1 Tax=Thiohalophilus thiocyanatoxydans TaxID=381308 RepID=A0A4R8IST8_9GAMM|nr:MOSC domain-containing protein [Thiohalophilus thiocyanatoxydans]TDY00629.1 MOSC domain-containing protein YiiM [Thiohalophilus thiocyanatoxydans]
MHILSVNVGSSQEVTIKNRPAQTGIYKMPVTGTVTVTRFGLQGDVRIEKRKMGLEHSAVYAYPFEHYAYWQRKLGRDEPFPVGQFGENLTVTGLLEEEVRIGDVFRFGNTVLQVAYPRIPCNKLNERMGLRFAPMFLASRKVGYYFRVLSEGTLKADDGIELLERDESSPTMEEFVRISFYEYWDSEALQYLLQARDLMPAWRETIEAKLNRAQTANGWHGLRKFEVVRREQESEDTFLLDLKCAKGRPLAPFHGGQQLTVVLAGHSANQQRQPCILCSNPKDLSTYRIIVRHRASPDPTDTHDPVASHLVGLETGEHIFCNAPHGTYRTIEKENDRLPVLISQGLGIAPMLSLLYELEEQRNQLFLFHQPGADEPQRLKSEVRTLLARNPDWQMIQAAPDRLNAERVRLHAPLINSDIHVAGSRAFVEHLVNEFMGLDISPAAWIVQHID